MASEKTIQKWKVDVPVRSRLGRTAVKDTHPWTAKVYY
jgi:hypothetical protein